MAQQLGFGDKESYISSKLTAMGYEAKYIERAMAVHRRSKRGSDYSLSLLIDIISRLKAKDASKRQSTEFVPHFESAKEALKLEVADSVDYRCMSSLYVPLNLSAMR